MNTPDLITLIPRCHEASKANGWWDVKPNQGQALMLIVSELSEALEADRNGRHTNMEAYNEAIAKRWANDPRPPQNPMCTPIFEGFVKDTAGDELADAYIRLCDFAGGFGYTLAADGMMYQHMVERRSQTLPENFGEALLTLTRHVINLHQYGKGKNAALTNALTGIEALCKREGIDLATHIDLKLAYNATRGVRHGGKAY